MLQIGSLVDGKYKILNRVGQGGMSVVYLAMNERANKQWAIKEVRKDGTSDFEVVKQGLVAEIDLLKKLNHTHLPSIIDVLDFDDSFLIVMDYIEGNPLSKALAEYGAQSQEDVVKWSRQLCEVLGYLHSKQIIYRDMKPANVMLKPTGDVMLIDFGTAREFKSDRVQDTVCLGTRGYAAPEQFGGQGQTDARTDIYCLGATMYHLVTGHNPCEPPYEMYPIRHWNPQLSSGLESIITKCTKRDPAQRYQSAAELLFALEHYRELDVEYKRQQGRRLGGFITCVAMTLVFAAGMVGFKMAETSEISSSYDAYITNARQAYGYALSSKEEAIKQGLEDAALNEAQMNAFYSDIRSAVNLDPTNREAYDLFLDTVMEDNVFAEGEAAALRQFINDQSSGRGRNIERLESANREAYETFCFNLGQIYYFFYEGDGNKALAGEWLQIAAEGSQLGDAQKQLAKTLWQISDYYAGLNAGGDTWNSSGETYATYWESLVELSAGNVLNRTGDPRTTLGIYKEVVAQVRTNPDLFRDAGVSQEQLMGGLDQVEANLSAISVGEAYTGLQQAILTQIPQARRNVENAFANQLETRQEAEDE